MLKIREEKEEKIPEELGLEEIHRFSTRPQKALLSDYGNDCFSCYSGIHGAVSYYQGTETTVRVYSHKEAEKKVL
ncbi:hypothetical protein NECAME_02441 [Necator americanus]|uniref:Uncharacterized protein n=1 Tax=Necator americanus TaxID=51031 RepID=W2TFF0_NECAM|nr:hypothetical protein NECAME_02441 [Necator americanus]ETN80309.1 hypothetical protein NECAME_02441 [Necator americanus]